LIKTHVYIDGFNLYYGLLKDKPYKWLNLESFCHQILPHNHVQKIYYFTAKLNARLSDPEQPTRQLAYLQALATLPRVEVHYGTFLNSGVAQVVVDSDPLTGKWRKNSGTPVLKLDQTGHLQKEWILKSEEKGSDVNLASYLLRDAYKRQCDCAVIMSNDSDLLTPIRLAKEDCGLIIGLVPPRPKGSIELKKLADFKIDPRVHILADSQFPDPIVTSQLLLRKPVSW
jgi:uncharacterized LabA/DUF88 family protein